MQNFIRNSVLRGLATLAACRSTGPQDSGVARHLVIEDLCLVDDTGKPWLVMQRGQPGYPRRVGR